ncbi:hypothetical protein ANCDUO_12513 [Ancylostoma duodenale]|uniref:Uncharacterized protein n=1 Tax=Ancylostoma duodenale TaxID=51022 RepID=A0A0C2D5A9_9BILA|nr:hypothetical protein ANCDUO_12513 [Ancylostoma duodenale]
MAVKAVVALLLLMLPSSAPRLLCGVELITSNIMEMFVKLDCPDLYTRHKKCCTEHGVCYVFRKPYHECDRNYCGCVYKIAGKAGGTCQTHGENFCNLVKDTGRNVYHLHGRR